VRLDFEGQVELLVKLDDAGIVDKGRANPGTVHSFGSRLYVTVQQSLDLLHSFDAACGIQPGKVDRRLKGLVDAVFAPGLCQCFQFDVCGRPANFIEVGLNLLHLSHIQGEHALPAEREQGIVIQVRQWQHFDAVLGLAVVAKQGRDWAKTVALDRVVAEEAPGQQMEVGDRKLAAELVPRCRGGLKPGDSQFCRALLEYSGCYVGNAGAERHFD